MSSTTITIKESYGSSKKIHQELVTPYKLTIVILIKSYCQFKDSGELDNLSITEKVKFRKSFCILSLKILQGPDLKLNELKSLLTPLEVLLPVFEKFDKHLEEIYSNSIGYLLDIVDEVKQIMNADLNVSEKSVLFSNIIWKNSVIGFFLRRFIVYFEKLNFSEVLSLYQAFLRYYKDWKNGISSTVISTTKIDEWYIDEKQWSRRQAELFLATQAALLQHDECKALEPQDLQSKISSILNSNPDLAEAHFLSFLNYLRVEEFCGAMQSLFHCFDRRANTDVKYFSDEKSREHRYAALNLAILHYHFGHMKEALASLKESIKIAHEANDSLCLQHALSWLYRLSNVNKDNLIVQCIIKTLELNISYTTSLALQNFAHYGSAKTSVKPRVIFETFTKSDMLNCQHNYKDLMFNINTMKAALWRLYGKTEMNSLWCQTLLYLNLDTNEAPTTTHYGEGYLQALCNIALNLLLQGEYNLVNALLLYAKRRYPNEPLSKIWMLVENWVVYTKALYNEDWLGAESAAQKIVVLDKWEGYLKLAELYLYQQEYEEADKCINTIFQDYNYNEHLSDGKFCKLRAHILMSEIQFASGYPNVSKAVLTLNSCLVEAEKSDLAYYVALIYLHIAHILLHLGLTSQSLKVLSSPKCMIEILANGGLYDKSRANLLYAKCLIADSAKLDGAARSNVIIKAAQSLETVKSGFQRIEAFSRAKDVLFLQAHLYNSVSMNNERNQCSLDYRLINEEHPTKNIQTLIKYL
ncbi:anaphase-promoting complex subunit 5 [Sitophilus oryzae]|uniref:Anaphase-promoting complex subunit 5 n=1 Tax=Sitophilus oryzae TaxID=7048 RepID=A0A6J2YNM4_SITOR|nr:anaphase-promoting complex subunit 5 [Sitophilus oryzae]